MPQGKNEQGGAIRSNRRLLNKIKSSLIKSEGKREKIYMDPSGVPTVGVGLAMGSKNENSTVTLSKLHEINGRLTDGKALSLSPENYQKIKNLVGKYNTAENEDKREKIISANNSEKDGIRGVDYKLDSKRIDGLLESEVNKTAKRTEELADKNGIDLTAHPEGVQHAVVDMVFRGGDKMIFSEKKSPNATKALKEKNYGDLMGEVLYRSNKRGQTGVDRRNEENARRIWKSLPAKERKKAVKQLDSFRKIHADDVTRYEKRRKKRNINPPTFKDETKEESSGGGAVSVQAHTREGGSEHVRSHTRSRPRK